MAKVYAKVTGGSVQEIQANTVAEAKNKLGLTGNYSAVVNGESAGDDYDLNDDEIIVFAQNTKGA